MKVSELIARRRQNWMQLETLCNQLATPMHKPSPPDLVQFAALYRAACADLALADSYQLPPNTVQYLHQLVGRAHNQLYRSQAIDWDAWIRTLFVEVPQRILNDRCVQFAFISFWAVFIGTAVAAANPAIWPNFTEQMLGREQIDEMNQSFAKPLRMDGEINFARAGMYIQHNTGIGLRCFAEGLLIIPGVIELLFNAANIGASFGYMARPVAASPNFFEFVTAHGPFELTAIVLSAGAGLRLGVSIFFTNGFTRIASLQKTAQEAMPIMGAAMVMFFFAALIEGFISPTSAPYSFKAAIAIVSSGLLMYYFVVLGFPRGGLRAA